MSNFSFTEEIINLLGNKNKKNRKLATLPMLKYKKTLI